MNDTRTPSPSPVEFRICYVEEKNGNWKRKCSSDRNLVSVSTVPVSAISVLVEMRILIKLNVNHRAFLVIVPVSVPAIVIQCTSVSGNEKLILH